jgi:hypothetical protein
MFQKDWLSDKSECDLDGQYSMSKAYVGGED